MFTVVEEYATISDFEFWGRAAEVYDSLTDEAIESLDIYLEECEPMTETMLNDFMAYDALGALEELGYEWEE